ncbi:MAG: hypothetical protein ACXVX0_06290 [Blastococcus sp.]
MLNLLLFPTLFAGRPLVPVDPAAQSTPGDRHMQSIDLQGSEVNGR